ncbi:MAG TPA: subclass B3 metallo-beta-lactamase [Gemmatimonadaceae bacterium]|nr:subclass B3 metallo-beta-lactamase [Gemmatimonadaceae bacterium]
MFARTTTVRQVLVRLAVVSALAARALTAQVPTAWTDTIAPFRMIDNVHYVGSAGLSAFLITTPKGHILLDAGLPSNAPMVARNITRLGFALRDVRILLNSHAHYDHAGGLAALKRLTGARLFAMAGDTAALERGVYIGSESDASMRFPGVRVDSVLTDGSMVTLGGVTLTANLTAGHSAGCTSWSMPVTSDGAKHNAIFFCSASVAANRLAPRPQYPGIVADYRRTFARLRAVDADVFLAPHAELFDLRGKRGRIAAGRPNPFIDAALLRQVTLQAEAAFTKELARQEALPR